MIAVTANRFKSPGKVSEADWADYDTVGGLVSQDSGFYSQSDFSSQCLSLSLEENHGIIIHQVVLDIQTSEWEHLSETCILFYMTRLGPLTLGPSARIPVFMIPCAPKLEDMATLLFRAGLEVVICLESCIVPQVQVDNVSKRLQHCWTVYKISNKRQNTIKLLNAYLPFILMYFTRIFKLINYLIVSFFIHPTKQRVLPGYTVFGMSKILWFHPSVNI